MIIVRAPLRVSFFGGGTDLPGWFRHHGPGAVLSTSIDKYVYVTLRRLPPIFDFNYRVSWRQSEHVAEIADIQNPVVREVLRNYLTTECGPLELHYHADLPARSGLGSSSSFTVAALHAVHQMQGRATPKHVLAREAIRVEQDYLGEPVGSQDQVAVAHGGLNRIDFHADGDVSVDPIDISPRRAAELQSHLMLVFTRFTRNASEIERSKAENFEAKRAQLSRMYEMVGEGRAILEDRAVPLSDFGLLLDEAWRMKRGLSSAVSNGAIDRAYAIASEAGALGGKLLGAGGGGFLLFFVPPDVRADVTAALSEIEFQPGKRPVEVPFAFENEGSHIVLHDPGLSSNYSAMLEPMPARAAG